MNLWIRSQDRNVLLVINTVGVAENDRKSIAGFGIDGKVKVTLGDYKTEERALEVLDEIQNTVYINKLFNADIGAFKRALEIEGYTESEINNALKKISTYEMPKE